MRLCIHAGVSIPTDIFSVFEERKGRFSLPIAGEIAWRGSWIQSYAIWACGFLQEEAYLQALPA